MFTADSARAAKIAVFLEKSPYPSSPFSPLSIRADPKHAIFRREC